ncbi:hypothetical protein KW451_06080 [Vibrio fluvialis]|nr:hypothetical protein [Vibrio fluvialis]
MKKIEELTTTELEKYVADKYKGSCSFCGSKSTPYIFINNQNNAIYTELKAFDAYGNMNPFNPSTPVLPVACPDCGNLTYIMIYNVLNSFNQEDSQ